MTDVQAVSVLTGERGFNFCLLHAVIAIWRGLLAEMAGQQTGLYRREIKLP